MILHIPHASKYIPENLKNLFTLSDDSLSAELISMTDAYTDELFAFPGATPITFPYSRLLVDVERFPNDEDEPMSRVGMGMIYTQTSTGERLKRDLLPEERTQLRSFYDTHHQALLDTTERALEISGKARIIDCHSFPSRPLPCDQDQSPRRPDFCIGTDSFHTPPQLAKEVVAKLKQMGYSVGVNTPYAGTLVPLKHYNTDSRVQSIMIEVNRRLYVDEITGFKTDAFNSIKEHIQRLLHSIQAHSL